MPTYSIQAPNGKTYSIDGPEGASQDDVIAAMKRASPDEDFDTPPDPGLGDIAKDVGVQGVAGVGIGTAGLLGLPSTVAKGLNKGIDWLTGAKAPEGGYSDPLGRLADKAQQKIEDIAGAPKTTYGKYARSIGENVPAMIGGPESLALKGVGAVLGGIGSEAAGEAAEGTGYEGLARFGGGLLGGSIAGRGNVSRVRRRQADQMATEDQIVRVSQHGYEQLDNSPVRISEGNRQALGAAIEQQLRGPGANFHPVVHEKTFRLIDHELTNGKGESGVRELVRLHEALGNIRGEGAAPREAREAIRTVLANLTGNATHQEALANWAAGARLEEVREGVRKAGERTSSTGTGHYAQNPLMQEIRKVGDRWRRNNVHIPPEVMEQIERVVHGSMTSNAARYFGKFAPTGLPSMVAAIAAAHLGHTGLVAGGIGAKVVGDYLTRRQIQELLTRLQESAPVNEQMARIARQQNAAARQQMRTMQLRTGAAGAAQPNAPEEGDEGDVNDALANAPGPGTIPRIVVHPLAR